MKQGRENITVVPPPPPQSGPSTLYNIASIVEILR